MNVFSVLPVAGSTSATLFSVWQTDTIVYCWASTVAGDHSRLAHRTALVMRFDI
jgi:hypothetical protein